MTGDLRWTLEHAWCRRIGRPARDLEDYDPLTLQALLFYGEEAREELEKIATQQTLEREREWLESRDPNAPVDIRKLPKGARLGYHVARQTGDPLVDAWERAIARGEVPDLEKNAP